MTASEISSNRDKASALLLSRRIAEAMLIVKEMVNGVAKGEFIDEYNRLAMTYRYMLQYLTQGMLDPERESVLNDMIESLLVLVDRCLIESEIPTSYNLFYLRHKTGLNLDLADALHQYAGQCADIAEIKSAGGIIRPETLGQREKAESNMFNKVWSSYPISRGDTETICNALSSPDIPSYFKSMIVTALTLGLICFYDQDKLLLLANIYNSSADVDVQMRAIVGIIITLNLHRNRAALSSAVCKAMDAIGGTSNAEADVQSVFLRLARSRNTENVSKKMSEAIMPDMMKPNHDLMDKIRKHSSINDLSELEDNPEWQQWLDESGINKKMEELTELQMEGNDVFIHSFSMLKSYPFFQTLSNWFMPFHADHSALMTDSGDSDALMRLFDFAPFLCNSDKFSLALAVMAMPEARKKTLSEQFSGADTSMPDKADASSRKSRDSLADIYIHDLYRFFRLFSRQKDFKPIFESKFDLENIPFIGEWLLRGDSLNIVAEYYLKIGFFADAIRYYDMILAQPGDVDPRVFQKIGFAYQNTGDNKSALDYFKKYEMACDTDVWNIKHIAQVYRNLRNFDKAIEYFKKAEAISPGNIGVALSVGHCLLEKGNVAEAMNQYFKVDFIAGAKHKAWRPIAWCSFLTGNFSQSQEYYKKVINDDTPSAQDYLNYGHLLLCNGHMSEAVENYKNALNASGGDEQRFISALMADKGYLDAKGISENDLHLVADAVLMSNNAQKYQL